MNPVIVIPSYWSDSRQDTTIADVGVYDHATPLDKEVPELEACLSSLDKVRGVMRVVILLVVPPRCEKRARKRVETVCSHHPVLNTLVVGAAEATMISHAIAEIVPNMGGETVSLRGYGAIRNMGLAVAAILGHDVVVYLDDDEIALSSEFLVQAVYGLGQLNKQGLPIAAKTGYFLDRRNSPFSDESETKWYDRVWTKRAEFNLWMKSALSSTRISRSNYVCGGCFAVHAEAFTHVAFDPFITRGEDLDYLFDLRMNGLDVWFDNEWFVRHMPPRTPSMPSRFLQDIFRWDYEYEKLLVTNARNDLHRITPSSLMPYPGPWISDDLQSRVFSTTLRRALCCPEHQAYLSILFHGRKQALEYATQSSRRYLSFQTYWPLLITEIWQDSLLASRLLASGQAQKAR